MLYFLLSICVCLIIGITIMILVVDSTKKKANIAIDSFREKIEDAIKREEETRKELEPLRKYEKIRDIEKAEKKIINNSIEIQEDITDRTRKIKEYKLKLESIVQAMQNKIHGYGDEYIIPNDSVLDDLAEDYSHKEAGVFLKKSRKESRKFSKGALAVETTSGTPDDLILLTLKLFNSEVDEILDQVKSDNFGKLKQKIMDVFVLVNHLGYSAGGATISREYLELRLDELKWGEAVHLLKIEAREEQREIREQLKEDANVRKEAIEAEKEAVREEQLIAIALAEAEEKYAKENAEDRKESDIQIAELQQKLLEVIEKKRKISEAQKTRQGNLYVISNVGSFGEGIYKIGMTRRIDPMLRVKELSDASVPFSFDVHAMVQCDDAPKLEKELHRAFNHKRVNQVNYRKEFFRIDITEIKEILETIHTKQVRWTMASEAAEFKESMAKVTMKNEPKSQDESDDILDMPKYDLDRGNR
jgi:hypothetical protein